VGRSKLTILDRDGLRYLITLGLPKATLAAELHVTRGTLRRYLSGENPANENMTDSLNRKISKLIARRRAAIEHMTPPKDPVTGHPWRRPEE
jgi:hypothetical protein